MLLAVSPMVGNGLRWRFNDAVLLARTDGTNHPPELDGVRSVGWDGRNLPVRPGSVALLIVDTRYADPEVLRPALAPGGTLAVLGADGEHVVYPDLEPPGEHLAARLADPGDAHAARAGAAHRRAARSASGAS